MERGQNAVFNYGLPGSPSPDCHPPSRSCRWSASGQDHARLAPCRGSASGEDVTVKTTIYLAHAAEARGRNGLFRPSEIAVSRSPHERGPEVEITVSSKRIAELPPIILRLEEADAHVLVS